MAPAWAADPERNMVLAGVISDTHGLMRPAALAALKGADLIIHAGDIGKPEVLASLREIAPTHVVRGNIDTQSWSAHLPAILDVDVHGLRFHVVHNIAELNVDPVSAGLAAIVSGHSHKPSVEMRGGVLYLNPGSAGPRRFRLPVTIARVQVSGGQLRPEIVDLEP
jgi:putative phosphoesterase